MVEIFRNLGRSDALALRANASKMTQTEIIDNEISAPYFDPQKDYTSFPAGSPVKDENQVWLLLQPYNAAHYEGRPSTLRALGGLAHTKNPAKAKPWVDALGTSGMYMKDECYKDVDGKIYRCLEDNTIYDFPTYSKNWEEVV